MDTILSDCVVCAHLPFPPIGGTTVDQELRFDGRVAVVTGAGRGLGRAHALEFARRGARVVVNDLGGRVDGSGASADPGAQVVREIEALGGTAVANTSSVIPPEGGHAIVQTALDHFGRLDILVNNAGVLDTEGFLEASDPQIDRTLDTHIRGVFSVTRPALRVMLEQGYGRIVNTASGAVLGSPVGLAYQAGKSAMIAFTRALALIGADQDSRRAACVPEPYALGPSFFYSASAFLELPELHALSIRHKDPL